MRARRVSVFRCRGRALMRLTPGVRTELRCWAVFDETEFFILIPRTLCGRPSPRLTPPFPARQRPRRVGVALAVFSLGDDCWPKFRLHQIARKILGLVFAPFPADARSVRTSFQSQPGRCSVLWRFGLFVIHWSVLRGGTSWCWLSCVRHSPAL